MPMRLETPTVEGAELAENIIEQGPALLDAIEGLRVIEPSGWFERAIPRLLLAAYRRRLKMIIATVPTWVGGRILCAAEGVGGATPLWRELRRATAPSAAVS